MAGVMHAPLTGCLPHRRAPGGTTSSATDVVSLTSFARSASLCPIVSTAHLAEQGMLLTHQKDTAVTLMNLESVLERDSRPSPDMTPR